MSFDYKVTSSIIIILQELSYRKQIARQLSTQYVEGIYRPKHYTVTLKQRRRAIEALEARAPQYCDCGPGWPLLFKVHEIWSIDSQENY